MVGHADRPAGPGGTHRPGDITVAAGLAVGNGQQRGPDPPLEWRAVQRQRQIKVPPRSRKIFVQLPGGAPQQGAGLFRIVPAAHRIDATQARILRPQPQQTDGGLII